MNDPVVRTAEAGTYSGQGPGNSTIARRWRR
jgi:hypothetical protein